MSDASGERTRVLFRKSEAVVSRAVAGETVVVPVRGGVGDLGSVYTFNGVGSEVWEMVDGGRTAGEMAAEIERRYEVPGGQALRDVEQFLDELSREGLVECVSPPEK